MISNKLADETNILFHDDLEQEDCTKLHRKRSLFDIDFDEELPDSAGRYTCPNENCISSNYVFGFESRTERNKHTAECPYGDGNVPLYVTSDGQMPSAKLINELVDAFKGNPNYKILFRSVSFYEELGQMIFEGCSDGSGRGGNGSSDGGKGDEFLGNCVTEEKVNEAVDQASAEVGFQVGVIDEFLNEKSYLLDDDICLE